MAQWDGIGTVEDWGRYTAGTAPRPETPLDLCDYYAARRYAVAVLEVTIEREIRHRRDDLARVRSYIIAADTIGATARMMDAGYRLAQLLTVIDAPGLEVTP